MTKAGGPCTIIIFVGRGIFLLVGSDSEDKGEIFFFPNPGKRKVGRKHEEQKIFLWRKRGNRGGKVVNGEIKRSKLKVQTSLTRAEQIPD